MWRAVLCLLAACGGRTDCASLEAGLARDTCNHDAVLAIPADQLDRALTTVSKIEDPVVRGAAVFTWVSQNNRELNPQRGMSMCRLLDGRERVTCERKLSSVHLRR